MNHTILLSSLHKDLLLHYLGGRNTLITCFGITHLCANSLILLRREVTGLTDENMIPTCPHSYNEYIFL